MNLTPSSFILVGIVLGVIVVAGLFLLDRWMNPPKR